MSDHDELYELCRNSNKVTSRVQDYVKSILCNPEFFNKVAIRYSSDGKTVTPQQLACAIKDLEDCLIID